MRIQMDDGVGLAVEVTGTGGPLLLVHGFGGAKEDFADHVAGLAEHATVVVFDHHGHGASDHPADEGAYSLDRLVADTLGAADALGFGRFRVVGHSMGGMVARRLVLAHPARVDALVLMDTGPGPPPGVEVAAVDLGVDIARTDGMAVLKAVQDELDPLGTPAYQRVLGRTRPGYQPTSASASGRTSVVDMWIDDRIRARPSARPARRAAYPPLPHTRHRRRAGHHVPGRVAGDGRQPFRARRSSSCPTPATRRSSRTRRRGSPRSTPSCRRPPAEAA